MFVQFFNLLTPGRVSMMQLFHFLALMLFLFELSFSGSKKTTFDVKKTMILGRLFSNSCQTKPINTITRYTEDMYYKSLLVLLVDSLLLEIFVPSQCGQVSRLWIGKYVYQYFLYTSLQRRISICLGRRRANEK